MYNRYIPNGASYTRVVEEQEAAPPSALILQPPRGASPEPD